MPVFVFLPSEIFQKFFFVHPNKIQDIISLAWTVCLQTLPEKRKNPKKSFFLIDQILEKLCSIKIHFIHSIQITFDWNLTSRQFRYIRNWGAFLDKTWEIPNFLKEAFFRTKTLTKEMNHSIIHKFHLQLFLKLSIPFNWKFFVILRTKLCLEKIT